MTRTAGEAIAVREAARRRLYVHIGMHKTGTTSIQYALDSNQDKLREHGILYPRTGRHPIAHVQHDLVYRALSTQKAESDIFSSLEKPVAETLFRNLKKEIEESNCHSVVLSAENLWLLSREEIESFHNHLCNFDVIPIIFVRRFSDFVESLHLTKVRIDKSYAESVNARKQFWHGYDKLDLTKCIADWSSISKGKKVVVHSYDNVVQDSVFVFFQLIGLSSEEFLVPPTRFNKSPEILGEALRVTCCENGIDPVVSQAVLQQFALLEVTEKHTLLPDEVRQTLDQNYEEQLARLVVAKHVITTDRSTWKVKRDQNPIKIGGVASILFAVGRALARDKRVVE